MASKRQIQAMMVEMVSQKIRRRKRQAFSESLKQIQGEIKAEAVSYLQINPHCAKHYEAIAQYRLQLREEKRRHLIKRPLPRKPIPKAKD